MSFLIAAPEVIDASAADLARLGSAIAGANLAAIGPTTGPLAPASDMVSAAVTSVLTEHAHAYQSLSAQVSSFHEQFVRALGAASGAYASAEAANASPLQTVEQAALGAVGTPTQAAAAAVPAGNGVSPALAVAPSSGPGAFGAGGSGMAGRLMGSVGPVAAAAGSGESFGMGGAGFTGSLVAGQNLGAVPAAAATAGPAASSGAIGASEGVAAAEEAGLGGYAGTPLPATMPAAAPAGSSAAVRPATPAYSPATGTPAESSEE